MKKTITTGLCHLEWTITDEMIVNPDDYIPTGKFNPHHIRPWLIHNEYGVLCVVFASCEQDALDEAVDNDRLDSCLIAESDYADYGVWTDDDESAHLGNAGEPFDLTYIGLVELPNNALADFCPQDEDD